MAGHQSVLSARKNGPGRREPPVRVALGIAWAYEASFPSLESLEESGSSEAEAKKRGLAAPFFFAIGRA